MDTFMRKRRCLTPRNPQHARSIEGRARTRTLTLLGTLACLWLTPHPAAAQIKNPAAHPRYSFEAEPHLLFVDNVHHGVDELGLGFRGTAILAHQAFVPSINNSVGVGFGLDFLFGGEHCYGPRNCHDHGTDIWLPVVLQWDFWLHKRWSVFAEPGFAIQLENKEYDADGDGDLESDTDLHLDPIILDIGGRFHMTDSATLTLRLGFPAALSFGVSFLL
jgi:hypothetical protein